jgi:hypothetical protein
MHLAGKWWHIWLGYYATIQQVEGAVPNEVTGCFTCPNPSSLAMALGSTQPLNKCIPGTFLEVNEVVHVADGLLWGGEASVAALEAICNTYEIDIYLCKI